MPNGKRAGGREGAQCIGKRENSATMFRRRQREKEPKKKWRNGEIEMQKAKKTNVQITTTWDMADNKGAGAGNRQATPNSAPNCA